MESRTSTEQSSLHLQNEIDEIELILKPHPNKELSLTSKRFLKTTSNATSKLELSYIIFLYFLANILYRKVTSFFWEE